MSLLYIKVSDFFLYKRLVREVCSLRHISNLPYAIVLSHIKSINPGRSTIDIHRNVSVLVAFSNNSIVFLFLHQKIRIVLLSTLKLYPVLSPR